MLIATSAEQDEQQDQDPDPFVVLENITEASHIFILSLMHFFWFRQTREQPLRYSGIRICKGERNVQGDSMERRIPKDGCCFFDFFG